MSIRAILNDVKAAGTMALEMQREAGTAERRFKADESVVTETDHRIEKLLVRRISASYPEANILTEETDTSYDPQRPLTFALDPIDGTDVYSQGMPGWCISVGLLDQDLIPIEGIILAPRLDLLIVADGDEGVTMNDMPMPAPDPVEPISVRSNLMVTSRIHKHLDLSGYVGKIRSIGSAALHLCYPLIYEPVIGALEGPGAHIWDMAAAHAINRAQGRELIYLSGDPVRYAPLVDGRVAGDIIMSGDPSTLEELRQSVERLS